MFDTAWPSQHPAGSGAATTSRTQAARATGHVVRLMAQDGQPEGALKGEPPVPDGTGGSPCEIRPFRFADAAVTTISRRE